MDPNQDQLSNPFGMDEECTRCEALCDTRSTVVHGYGDVSAEFVFVGEMPSAGADETGHPFTGDENGERLLDVLYQLGFTDDDPTATEPELDNAYLTYLTRCRHPDRGPTDEEVRNCEGYLTADLRMINPEIIVPIGQRSLEALAVEYTTKRPGDFDIETDHATTIRGRGFELVPLASLGDLDEERTAAFVEHFSELLGRDYRQTKGRRSR